MTRLDEQDWIRQFMVPRDPTIPIEIENASFNFSLTFSHCGDGQFPITFVQCIFRQRVKISGKPGAQKNLTKPIIFHHCTFKRSLSLVHLIATNKVEFQACLFEDYTDFSHTHFESSVRFHDSTFKKKAYFQGTKFKALSCFTEADFLDGSDFDNAHFAGLTTFEKATFGGATTFSNPSFDEVAPKNEPQFIFRSSQIFGFVGFRSEPETAKTSPKLFQLNPNDDSAISADFRNIYIQSSRGLRFHSANLMKIRFAGTNLNLCYFNDVTWPELLKRKGQKRRVTIYCLHDQNHDEFFSLQSKRGPTYQDILAQLSKAYRDLKVIYEQEHDYIYASDFHYLEKDLRRKNRDVPLQTKIQLWLYYWASGYGERVLRPLFLAITVFLMGAFTYYDALGSECRDHLEDEIRFDVQGTESSVAFDVKIADGKLRKVRIGPTEEVLPEHLLHDKIHCKAMWEASLESIETMTLLRTNQSSHDQDSFIKHSVRIFQMIAGPALAAMFVLAIKNKLKR